MISYSATTVGLIDTNTWIFVRFFDVTIKCFKIEFKLPQVFWLKFIDFEFKSNKTLKFTVKKEQVDEEVTVTDLQPIFLSQEGEVPTEFQDEISEAGDKRSFQVVLGVVGRQIEKVEDVAIAKDSRKRFRMACLEEFCIRKASPLEDATVDLTIEFTGAVVFSSSELKIKESLVFVFATRD